MTTSPGTKSGCQTHHSVVFHVAGFADGLVVLHHISLSSQDAVTVETAEMLQMPVLSLRLSVFITEDQLWTHTRTQVSTPF